METSAPSPELASLLAAAHQHGRLLTVGALPVPASLDAAMAVQADVVRRLGAEVAGWNVAISPDGLPVAAPLLRHPPLRGGR